MARKTHKSPRLAAGEIELLQVLWRTGGATIAEVQSLLGRELGYTTVQTRLNRMAAKGVVRRSDDRPARYMPGVSREEVSADDVWFIVDRVTDGQVAPLVAHLVQDRHLPQSEIDELKRLIAQAEERTNRTTKKRGHR
jgi:BlaI family transcriptional regulator, penicillinase repressor